MVLAPGQPFFTFLFLVQALTFSILIFLFEKYKVKKLLKYQKITFKKFLDHHEGEK